jgi:hypothetical protein
MLKRHRALKSRGQSAVEYILIAAMVAGAVMVFQKALEPALVNFLSREKNTVTGDAIRGGKQDIREHYQNACSATASKKNC